MHNKRIEKLQKIAQKKKLDAILIIGPSNKWEYNQNLRYFTGLGLSIGFLVIQPKEDPVLFISSEDKSKKSWIKDTRLINKRKMVSDFLKKINAKKVGINDEIPYSWIISLQKSLPKIDLISVSEEIFKIRAIKDSDEIKKIEKACKISDKALEKIAPLIKEGISEIKLVKELEYWMRKYGADGTAFETTILSSKNSVEPHGKPGITSIKNFVLIDFGADYQGYKADISHFFILRKNLQIEKIYSIVRDCLEKVEEQIKPGTSIKELDDFALNFLKRAGYGKYSYKKINLCLGHGVGLDVHESPNFFNQKARLKEGNIITIEPGVYIPNLCGCRVEDIILVTKDGCKILNKSPKHVY